jgi:hypothetical protein
MRSLKSEYQTEAKARYDEKRKEIFDRIYWQFTELRRNSEREVDAYVQRSPPSMQEKVGILKERSCSVPAARPPRTLERATNSAWNAGEDLAAVLSEATAEGDDLPSLVILSDGSFLCAGRVYSVGDLIRITTRIPGHPTEATVVLASATKVVLQFKDNTSLSLPKADLVSGRVTFA